MIRVSWVRRSILNPKLSGPLGFFWAVATLLLAAALRMELDRWVTGVPFLTFFPTVQIASLLLGWRWGAMVLAGGALMANFAFQPPFMAFSLRPNELVSSGAFLLAGSLMIWASESLRRAIFALEASGERERALNLELAHRVNNSLTVVQGLAKQTSRVHSQPEVFYEMFSGRLLALSQANKILMSGAADSSQLPDLATAALQPFLARQQMTAEGPRCALPSSSTVPLVLALHELGTNATKYGALSVPAGHVEVNWRLERGACRVRWTETGGPAVKTPTRRGLGTRLLTSQPGLDEVRLDFDPEGVRCEITIRDAVALQDPAAGPAESRVRP